MLPSTLAPALIRTPRRIFGWRSPVSLPVPPSVTPCSIDTSSSTTAVSPTTTPVAWSMNMPRPKRAAGWMSTPNTSELRLCRCRARVCRPCSHSQCAIRCVASAWKPFRNSSGFNRLWLAGSRSCTAAMSARRLAAIPASATSTSSNSGRRCCAERSLEASLPASRAPSAASRLSCASTALWSMAAMAGSSTVTLSASVRIPDQTASTTVASVMPGPADRSAAAVC